MAEDPAIEAEAALPDADATAPRDVHAVLEEIGAQGAFADLEARVRDLEQDLERAETRAREADKGRQGELDLMRARIDEAMELVRSSMEEQRAAFHRFEERFAGAVEQAERSARGYVDELRDELTPRVQRTVVRTDEVAAELRGDLRALEEELAGRNAAAARLLEEARDELRERIEAAERTRADERQDGEAAAAALERGVEERLAAAEAASRARQEEERERVEALRRELDAAVGELRAGLNLRAGELVERIEDARLELTERLEEQEGAARGLEQRWVDGTRDIAARVEQVVATVRQATTGERAAREGAQDELAQRVEELSRTVADVRDRLGADDTRRSGELEAVRLSADELRSRLVAVEGKVTDAVGTVASQLTNRVAELSGNLEAVLATTVRHEERLAGLDHVERRVSEVAARTEELTAPRPDPDRERLGELVARLGDLRQRDQATAERLQALHQQLRDLAARVAGVTDAVGAQDALRQEVRELAARSSELTHRLDETERVARAAGQAISRAVRLTRQPGAATGPPRPASVERAARRLEESAEELQALDATDTDEVRER